MKDLPLELVGAVVESISSIADLLSLRSVNTTYLHLVMPYCVPQHNYPQQRAKRKKVVYDPRNHAEFQLLPANPQGARDELEAEKLQAVLTDTLCSLSGFENLETVVLNFWPSFRSQCGAEIQEPSFWFFMRQMVVLHAVHVALKSSRMCSLTLNNVILAPMDRYDFVLSLTDSPLHHFSITVVSNSELGGWFSTEALNDPVSSLLPSPNANLKSFILRTSRDLYHNLTMQLRSFHYHELENIMLENVVFDHIPSEDGIEEFIIRHRTNLRRLELRGCASYVPNLSTPVRRWTTICKRFGEELVLLRELVVDGGDA